MTGRLIDLSGKILHNLTVLNRASSSRQGSSTWNCKCICGREVVLSSDHLTRKKSPVKSCGCLAIKKGEDNPLWTGYKEISGNWWHCHVTRERTQTRRAKIPVTITIEYAYDLYLKQNKSCSLSGVPLVIANSGRYNTASIDRIDNSKGYEEGNIQWVHKHINFMKRNYSQEYFIELCNKISAHNNSELI